MLKYGISQIIFYLIFILREKEKENMVSSINFLPVYTRFTITLSSDRMTSTIVGTLQVTVAGLTAFPRVDVIIALLFRKKILISVY